jgi:hypothetical protein
MSDEYRAALTDYVEKAKAAGMSYDEVREGLISGGWDAAMVDQMLPVAFGEPAPAAAPPAAMLATPPAAEPAQPPAYAPTTTPSQPPAYAPPTQAVTAPPAYGTPVASPGFAGSNTSGQGQTAAVPPEVEALGWSWGGFGLNWIWAIGNKTWIGLLALIPCVNLFVAIWLGISGHKLAWQNRRFDSLGQFQETMKAWNLWGLIIFVVSIALNIISWLIRAASNH